MAAFWNAIVVTVRSRPEFLDRTTALFVLLGGPIVTAVLYLALATGGGSAAGTLEDAVASGLAVAGVAAGMAASALLASDQHNGTLPFIVVSPTRRAAVWLGRVTVVVGLGVFEGAVGTLATLAVTSTFPPPGVTAAVLGLILEAAVVSVGLGAAIGAAGLVLRDSMLLPNIAEQVVVVLCGAVAPVGVLWPLLQVVARGLPLSWSIEAGRALADGAVPIGASVTSAVVGAGWAAVAVLLWSVLERRARRTGAIESMSLG
jgi:ABC-type multidrug transport system permease subunit